MTLIAAAVCLQTVLLAILIGAVFGSNEHDKGVNANIEANKESFEELYTEFKKQEEEIRALRERVESIRSDVSVNIHDFDVAYQNRRDSKR